MHNPVKFLMSNEPAEKLRKLKNVRPTDFKTITN